MVKIGLQFKANLENITNLRPEGKDFRWYIRLKCLACGEETHDFQYLTLLLLYPGELYSFLKASSLKENSPLKGGRGHASMVLKCSFCHRENSIDILEDTIMPYSAEDSGHFKTIVHFDCRGVEPVDFSTRVGFVAEGTESGTKFQEVDLKDGEWCDYDEKSKEPVGVNEIEHKFIKVK